ncbi:MAG: calcium/sodium antiporter [Flavobacteriaceae bacterium]
MSLLLILLGLVLLVVGGEFLVRSSVALSFKFHISKLVIGMTVVSFATSAPELLVSLNAALNGHSDISLGNVIGSNIANLGLVLGITAFIFPISISRDFYRFNWPMMMLLSIVLYFFLKSGNVLDFREGVALFISLIIFTVLIIRNSRANRTKLIQEVDDALQQTSNFKIVVWLLIGGSALYFGSEWLVYGATEMAKSLGVTERVISITVVAIGTSVPELAASVVAAFKKEKAISLGNLIGSNIFNIASVLGLTAIVKPIVVQSEEILTNDLYWMIAISFIILPLALIPKKFVLDRRKGLLLLLAYVVFISLTIIK